MVSPLAAVKSQPAQQCMQWSALLGALVVVLGVTRLLVAAGPLWRPEHSCTHNSMDAPDAGYACQSSIAHWVGKEPAGANSAARDWR